MSKCCASPPKDLVAFNKSDKACKVKSPNLNIFNTYTLNKLQNDNKDNDVYFDAKTKVKLVKDAVNITSDLDYFQ